MIRYVKTRNQSLVNIIFVSFLLLYFILNGGSVLAQDPLLIENSLENNTLQESINTLQESIKTTQTEIESLRNDSYQQLIASYQISSSEIDRLIFYITLISVIFGIIISVSFIYITTRSIISEKEQKKYSGQLKMYSEKAKESSKEIYKIEIETIKTFKKLREKEERIDKLLQKPSILKKQAGIAAIKKLKKEIAEIKDEINTNKMTGKINAIIGSASISPSISPSIYPGIAPSIYPGIAPGIPDTMDDYRPPKNQNE